MNQRKVGAFLQYLQMGLAIVIGLVYTPMMIKLLGQSEYGLYNTVSSTVSMLSLLSLGFNSSYIRYYAKYKRDNDENAISKLNGLFLIIFSIIGIIAFFCGLFLSNNLTLIFDAGLTENEYNIAKVLMLLLTINLALSFPFGIFMHIINAHERFILLKLLSMLKTVVSPLVTLPLLLMGYRSIAMVSVTVGISLLVDLIYCVYSFSVLKIRFVFHGFEKGLFRSLLVYTSFIAINMVVDQINWNIDKVLLARFKGTTSVAIYSVGFSLYSYYQMFSTAVSSVFTPQIHRIINETQNDKLLQREKLTLLFTKVGRIQFIILSLISTGLVFFGFEFITKYWAGPGYEDAYYVTLLLVFPASIALIQNLGIEIQRAQNLHRFRSIAYFFMALANLFLSIILCKLYGAIGSAIGTAISLIIANGLIMNVYYYKKCNINIIYFWKEIFSASKGLVIPCLIGIVYHFVSLPNNTSFYVLSIMVYSLVFFVSMWICGMNKYEKNLITSIVNKNGKIRWKR